jgi:hypothetical protein
MAIRVKIVVTFIERKETGLKTIAGTCRASFKEICFKLNQNHQ